MTNTLRICSALLLAASFGCGDDESTPTPDAAGGSDSGVTPDAPSGADGPAADAAAFALSSTDFTPGGALPEVHSCNGANTSPALSWTGGPAGTMAYAYVFIDRDFSPGGVDFRHSIIWDIPVATTSLPAATGTGFMLQDPAGAKQPVGWDGMRAYRGPCPGEAHTYEFVLYAVDEYPLTSVGMGSSMADVEAQLEAHKLATVGLQTVYTP